MNTSLQDQHRRLLELEEQISQISGSEISSRATPPRTDFKPPPPGQLVFPEISAPKKVAAGSSRPSSASRSTPTAAADGSRLQSSSRSSHTSLGSSPFQRRQPRPGSARPRGELGQHLSSDHFRSHRPREKKSRMSERDFREFCARVGLKAASRYKTVHDCFRFLDEDKSGTVDRSELRRFFNILNVSNECADKFFDMMDDDNSGIIDYNELRALIGPYIQPGYASARPSPSPPDWYRVDRELKPSGEALELQTICNQIGDKMRQKYRSYTDCFRFVDGNHDGGLSRDELVQALEGLSVEQHVSHRLFSLLAAATGVHPKRGELDMNLFRRLFEPYIRPGYRSNLQAAALRTLMAQLPGTALGRPTSAHGRKHSRSSIESVSTISGASSLPTSSLSGASDSSRRNLMYRTLRSQVFAPNADRGQVCLLAEDRMNGKGQDFCSTWDSAGVRVGMGSAPVDPHMNGVMPRPPSAPRPARNHRRRQSSPRGDRYMAAPADSPRRPSSPRSDRCLAGRADSPLRTSSPRGDRHMVGLADSLRRPSTPRGDRYMAEYYDREPHGITRSYSVGPTMTRRDRRTYVLGGHCRGHLYNTYDGSLIYDFDPSPEFVPTHYHYDDAVGSVIHG